MYTFEPPILYPEASLRGACLRSAPKTLSRFVAHPKVRGAVRFLFGGFSSTAGYVPGNEARDLSKSRATSTLRVIISESVTRFYPNNPVDLPADLGKPFGFDSGRPWQRLSAPSAIERCVTASVPPPGAGQNARKQSRLCRNLTRLIFDVK